MRRGPALYIGVCRAMTYATCLHVAFTITAHAGHGDAAWSGLGIWMLGCALCVVVNEFLLDREPALPLVAGVNVVLFAGLAAALIMFSPLLPSTFSRVALGILAAISWVLAYQIAATPPSISRSLSAFDTLLLALLAIVAISESATTLRADVPLMLLLLALDLVANVILRGVEDHDGATVLASPVRGVLFAVAAFVVVGAVSLGLVQLVAFSADSAVDALIAGITALGAALWRALNWLMGILARFFGTGFEVAPTDAPQEGNDGADEIIELSTGIDFSGAGVVIVALIAIVAIALIVRFRRKRLGSVGRGRRGARPVRARIATSRENRFALLLNQLRFNLLALRHRNTPAGQLVALEWKARRAGSPRQPGETMREFIGRMAPDDSLASLANALEEQFFSQR